MLITQLWRYPVKSLAGEQLHAVEVSSNGLEGDRRWGLEDQRTGHFLTARREPRLLLASSKLVDGEPKIVLPDGAEIASNDDLSQWLGFPVALVPAPEHEVSYESPSDAVDEREWYTWSGPGSALHDEPFARVSITSETRLGLWDVRRFRPNIVVDTGDERTLVGHKVQAGSVLLDVKDEIPRCVMLTRPQAELARDLDVLKAVNRNHDGKFSVGALVSHAGRLSIGDAVTKPV